MRYGYSAWNSLDILSLKYLLVYTGLNLLNGSRPMSFLYPLFVSCYQPITITVTGYTTYSGSRLTLCNSPVTPVGPSETLRLFILSFPASSLA